MLSNQIVVPAQSASSKYDMAIQDAIDNSEHLRGMICDGDAAKGECETAAKIVVESLHNHGYKGARMVAVQKRLAPVEDGPWQLFATSNKKGHDYLWHAVVDTGDGIIDSSGVQYGTKYAGIRVMTYAEANKEWGEYLPEAYRQSSKTKKFPKVK